MPANTRERFESKPGVAVRSAVSCPLARPLAKRLELRQAAALDLGQLLERLGDVGPLLLQQRATASDLAEEEPQLPELAGRGVVEVDDLADLADREAEALAAQDQLEADTVARREQPGVWPRRAGLISPSSS